MLSIFLIRRVASSNLFKLLLGLTLIMSCLLFLRLLIQHRPLLSDLPLAASQDPVRFPRNLPEAKQVARLFSRYKQNHPGYVLLLFCSAYVFKQAFAIPGSFILNILAGAIFGVMHGFCLVVVMCSLGTTSCYILSRYFGRDLVEAFFPNKIHQLRHLIANNRESLFFYLLSLRLFPMTPNWLLNMALPLLNVPLRLFVPSTLLGLAPYNLLTVQTGSILSELTSFDRVFAPSVLVKMLMAAALALLPGLIIRCTRSSRRRSDLGPAIISMSVNNSVSPAIEVKLD